MSRKKRIDHIRLLKQLRRERRKVDQLQEIIRKLHKRLRDRDEAKPRQPTKPPTVSTTPIPPTSDPHE